MNGRANRVVKKASAMNNTQETSGEPIILEPREEALYAEIDLIAANKHLKEQKTAPQTKENITALPQSAIGVFVPDQTWSTKDFQKLKVAELREELQNRGLQTSGLKEELINRLLVPFCNDNCLVGRNVLPKMGMRVRHVNGPNHGSSKGMGGVIEYIPGRGAFRSDEKSVSVRWDVDKSDVRGPYYTGEPCDRGSGIGTPKFDLICLDSNPELIVTSPNASLVPEAEKLEITKDVLESPQVNEQEICGLQEENELSPIQVKSSLSIQSEPPLKDEIMKDAANFEDNVDNIATTLVPEKNADESSNSNARVCER